MTLSEAEVEGITATESAEKKVNKKKYYGAVGGATLIVADAVGTGVLALPGDARTMGLIVFMIFLLLNVVLNVCAGYLLNAAAGHSRARDFIELAKIIHASPSILRVIVLAWYGNLLLVLGNYVLVMARGLDLVAGNELCTPISSFAAAAFVLMLAQANRTMLSLDHGPSQISILSVVAIIVLCLWRSKASGDQGVLLFTTKALKDRLWPRVSNQRKASAKRLGSSFGSVVFAVNSQKLLLNVRAEMADTKYANTALIMALSFYVTAYAAIVLAAGPDPPAFLLDVFLTSDGRARTGFTSRCCGFLLFAHVAVSFAINQQALAATVISRFFHIPVNNQSTLQKCYRHAGTHRIWFFVTFFITLCAWLVANAIPFFQDLVALIGALTATPLSFAFPMLLYSLASKFYSDRMSDNSTIFTPIHDQVPDELPGVSPTAIHQDSPVALKKPTLVVKIILYGFTFIVLIVGTVGAIASVVSHWEHIKRPFQC
mmetsp:Transcript_6087/g.9029  ORF Transcript_6087/g.9029 Transcript_6087/m.9029 type:complete len:487 (-) Transcript_6087:34-1494(-)